MMKKISLTSILFVLSSAPCYSMEIASQKKSRRTRLNRSASESMITRFSIKKKKQHTNDASSVPTKMQLDNRLTSLTEEKSIEKSITITPQTINNLHSYGETLLIWAARNNKQTIIEELIKYNELNINIQNIYKQTALHYIAEHKNKECLIKLLSDPRTNAAIKNNDGKTARDVIKGSTESDAELRRIIFARIMLDWTVNAMCEKISDPYTYLSHIGSFDTSIDLQEIILDAIKEIKDALIHDQDKQKDYQELPASAKVPEYATDEFIKEMISLRLKCINQQNT